MNRAAFILVFYLLRIKRLAIETIYYSKTEYMHDIIIGLFY